MGAAICAATAAGLYPTMQEAQNAMNSGFDATYYPQKEKTAIYDQLYKRYLELGEFIEKTTTAK